MKKQRTHQPVETRSFSSENAQLNHLAYVDYLPLWLAAAADTWRFPNKSLKKQNLVSVINNAKLESPNTKLIAYHNENVI